MNGRFIQGNTRQWAPLMCGILGIAAEPGAEIGVDRTQILSMRNVMQSRGPDGEGLVIRENVAFAHRRLAIRDRQGGTQPWVSPDGQCLLVYNGEIYNDGDLRSELSSLGVRFQTRSDTEVLMAAYRQWGADCVSRLDGMFAFGIYDFRDHSLLLVRDRFGVKPLFLAEIDGRTLFASSIAAILKHPRHSPAPHLPAISHYLTTLRLTLGRATVYRGIWQLLPGEMMVKRDGNISVSRYWDYPQEDSAIDFETATDQLELGLGEAVESRLTSDVPVGMFLSGGVDSSTIATLMRRATSKSINGRCGGDDHDSNGDFSFARRCAAHTQFDFDETRVSHEAYREHWQAMIASYATPVSTPSDVIIYRLAADMKRSVGVVLGGEGADELLCGYAIPHWAGNDFDRIEQCKHNRWNGAPATADLFRASLRRQYGRDEFTSPTDHYFALNSLIPSNVKPALLQPWAWQQANEDHTMTEVYSAEMKAAGDETTAARQTLMLHRINLESLLARLDSATMLASLEARVPFTDHRLVEQMFRVPRRFKIDVAYDEHAPYLCSAELNARGTLQSKRVLRRVARRLLPADLANRPKASFPTPVASWLTGEWQSWARETLLESPFLGEVFQPTAVQELAENIPNAGMWLWPIINVAQWGDRQFAA